MPQVVANILCDFVYRMEYSFCKFVLHTLLPCFKRRVMKRKAILGPPFRYGLYCMAWTVLAGWRWFLDFTGVFHVDELESKWYAPDVWGCPASLVFVARLRVALMGGVGRLKPSWREVKFFETLMSWAGSVFGVLCRYLQEEGELACLCLVSALVIQPVLLCSVLRRFVQCHR